MVGRRSGFGRRRFARAAAFCATLWGSAGFFAVPARAQVSGVQAGPPTLEVVPNVVRFVEVPVGETYTQTVRLANRGRTNLQIKRLAIKARGFAVSGLPVPLVLVPEDSATLTISYRSRTARSAVATLKIVTDGDAVATVEIAGSGVDREMELAANEA